MEYLLISKLKLKSKSRLEICKSHLNSFFDRLLQSKCDRLDERVSENCELERTLTLPLSYKQL